MWTVGQKDTKRMNQLLKMPNNYEQLLDGKTKRFEPSQTWQETKPAMPRKCKPELQQH